MDKDLGVRKTVMLNKVYVGAFICHKGCFKLQYR